ncbi:MAG: Type III restriction enzyme, res subunit, partial [Candidatus Giovannonibacteria bacterium GW2011_GWA2_44_26]
YTNVQSILVKKEDYNPNIIKHLKAKRIDSYEPIELMSYYKSRVDYGDVTSSFTSVFESVANKYFKVEKNFTLVSENIEKVEAKGITLNLKLFQQEIIVDTKLEGKSFDELEGEVSGEAFAKLSIAGNDLQVMFEQAIKDNLRSFRNVKRSVAPVKTALYNWFKKYLGSKQWPEEIMLIQKTFLQGSNRAILETILADSIETYRLVKEKEVQRKVQESEQIYQYELPAELFYNEHTDEKLDYDNYAFTPLYLPVDRSEPEKRFEELLNSKSDKITWWWKNGENKRDFFGIKYEYEGKIFTFYPDYLVQLEDGRLGILETKDVGDRDGKTYTKAKAEALQHFINTNSRKGLFGGIAIQRNGRWHINSQSIYDWSKNEHGSWDDWEDLVL